MRYMIPRFPPTRRAPKLMEERRDIILAALRGGKTYREAEQYALEAIPQDKLEQVEAEDHSRLERFLEQERADAGSGSQPNWLMRSFGWSKTS